MSDIDNGTFVSWEGGQGRVDLIVSAGKVPGVDGDVEGTKDAPAARVVVWKDGSPTAAKSAVPMSSLRRIAPLDASSATGPAALVALHASHAEAVEGVKGAALTGVAIKAAYDRGRASWPGSDVTTLSREEWGLGRAKHLTVVAAEMKSIDFADADLLDADHPAVSESPDVDLLVDPEGALPASAGAISFTGDEDEEVEGEAAETDSVTLDAADVEATLSAIRSESAAAPVEE